MIIGFTNVCKHEDPLCTEIVDYPQKDNNLLDSLQPKSLKEQILNRKRIVDRFYQF
jgi:hypothetical protein